MVWKWLSEEWSSIRSRLDTSVSAPLAEMVKTVTESFSTSDQLEALREFADRFASNLGSAERATESAIQTTAANVEWMERHYDDVAGWLMSWEAGQLQQQRSLN